GGTVEHRLHLPRAHAASILAQARTAIPGVNAVPLEDPTVTSANFGLEIGISDFTRSLRTDQPEAVVASILTALTAGPMHKDEFVTWQWVMWAAATGQSTATNSGQAATGLMNQILGTPAP